MKKLKMKSVGLAAVFLMSVMVGTAGAAFTFGDIEYWVGSGSNQAAMVIDWNDGKDPQSLVWGYRWDGTATGEDMIMAIAGTGDGYTPYGDDMRLFANLTYYGGLGYALFGLGYDLDGDGGSFISGEEGYETENGYATDPDDHYREGWYTGNWSYWWDEDLNDTIGDAWHFAPLGLSSHVLTDGIVDGWGFGCLPGEPVAAAPVPLPGAVWLLGSGLMGLAGLRRKPGD